MAKPAVPRQKFVVNDWIGKRFGRFTVLSYDGMRYRVQRQMLCRCDCGQVKSVALASLRNGHSQSCGCRQRELVASRCVERSVHGYGSHIKPTPEYRSWAAMIQRCENPNNPKYKNYGGRGIAIHSSIRQFEDFLAYMGPSNGLTLERKDVNGNYEPDNIIWLVKPEQAWNRRNTVWIAYEGKPIRLADAAKRFKFSRSTYYRYLARGMAPQAAFDRIMSCKDH